MDMLATDLAEYLVRKGVPFRETHHISGAAVKLAEQMGVSLNKLSFENLKQLHGAFEPDVAQVWDYERSVESRNTYGGTSSNGVKTQIDELRQWVENSK